MINTTDSLLSVKKRPAVIRTGTVTEVGATNTTSSTILVQVGNSSVLAGWLLPYVPLVGDLVAVARQDSSWLVLGPFQTDGTTYDTGWVAFTLGAGITPQGTGAVPSYRRIGNHVYWKGRVGVAAGTLANGTTLLTVPAGFLPSDIATANYGWGVARSANAGASSTCRIDIVASTGVLRTFDTTANLPTWVDIGEVNYLTD